MAEVYVMATQFGGSVPILTCDCGHRRPGGMGTTDEWFAHELTHVTDEHPEVGQFTTVSTAPNPVILPPLISKVRYLA